MIQLNMKFEGNNSYSEFKIRWPKNNRDSIQFFKY